MNRIIWWIILQLLLIALIALFTCAETAIFAISEGKLEDLADEGNKRAARLLKLTSMPSKFLTAARATVILAGFTASAFAAECFAGGLTDKLIKEGAKIPESVLMTVSVIVVTVILAFVTLVFGELVPKRAAMKNPEKAGFALSGVIIALAALFTPFAWFAAAVSNAVLRLMRIDPSDDGERVTEEEIRMMVDAGSEKGTIDEDEKEMIQNVFEFDDLTADEIATHRTDVVMLQLDESPEEWEKTIYESSYSHYPVCRETVDEIVGVLYTRDYFRLKDKSRTNVLKKAVKPAYFVPHSVNADVLFENMKKSGNYFAVVLDEYGGVHGIVTMTDLIEEIVGDINNGRDDEGADIERVDETSWKISGGADIDDVEKELDVKLNSGDYDTFGGFVISVLGYIPDDGQTVEAKSDGLYISVTEVKDHRIVRTVVKKPIEGEN